MATQTIRYITVGGQIISQRSTAVQQPSQDYMPDALGTVVRTVSPVDGSSVSYDRRSAYGRRIANYTAPTNPSLNFVGSLGVKRTGLWRSEQAATNRIVSVPDARWTTQVAMRYRLLGEQPYAYANGNPATHTDPTGLQVLIFGEPWLYPADIGDLLPEGWKVIEGGEETSKIGPEGCPKDWPMVDIGPATIPDFTDGRKNPYRRIDCNKLRRLYHKVCNYENGTSYPPCDGRDGLGTLHLKATLYCSCCLAKTNFQKRCAKKIYPNATKEDNAQHWRDIKKPCALCLECLEALPNTPPKPKRYIGPIY